MARTAMFIKCAASMLLAGASALANDALDAAKATADLAGYSVPPGWNVQFGATSTGAMGECDHASQTITIDPAAIDSKIPGLSDTPEELPGVLYFVLIHEIMHIPDGGGSGGSGGGGDCTEIAHQAAVAAENCELASVYASQGGSGAPLQNMCAFYNSVQDHYSGQVDPPGAQEAWDAAGCSGDLPSMPECGACE